MEKLALERKRSEELLYRMMPKAIADRLTLGGKAVETCEVCCIGEGCVTKIIKIQTVGTAIKLSRK